ncbi:hypothetical protein GCM10023340_21720 [Nocardioides marinquilinus]|uniref:PH domain-containing protein n=1 Tax=Nocardioides marinquilinus TaxID=1210400 RepID=A0ABP9PS53_9ACTN
MEDVAERQVFRPTSGRVSGVLALLVGLGLAVLGLTTSGGVEWALVAVGVFVAVLAWAAMLRPVVIVEDDRLVLRNMVDTVRIPLAAIEEIAVRQVLAVRVGERRFTSAAIGRSRRQIRRDDKLPGAGRDRSPVELAEDSYGMFVEDRIRTLSKQARERLGIAPFSDEQERLGAEVTKTPAVAEITGLAVPAVALVVLIVL